MSTSCQPLTTSDRLQTLYTKGFDNLTTFFLKFLYIIKYGNNIGDDPI